MSLPSALRSSERGVEALEAGLRPELVSLVVISEGRRSLRQLEPLRLPSGIDVYVRLKRTGIVECSNAHKPKIGPPPVIAPYRCLAPGAPIDFVRTIFTRHRHTYRFAAEQLDQLSFDDCVEHECTTRGPLTVVAMTAMDEHRLVQQLVPDGSAGAAAGEFLWHYERPKALVMPAHVFPHLVMPVRPVVSAFRAPVVQMMSDAAISEDL